MLTYSSPHCVDSLVASATGDGFGPAFFIQRPAFGHICQDHPNQFVKPSHGPNHERNHCHERGKNSRSSVNVCR